MHSSLRIVIERSFGVQKNEVVDIVRLTKLSNEKTIEIILTCLALHSFIRESAMTDADFDMCDCDENCMPFVMSGSSESSGVNSQLGDEDEDTNVFMDNIANALVAKRS